MKILQVLKNKKIEKKLQNEIMPKAWEVIEDMTGEEVINKEKVPIKLRDLPAGIDGAYTGRYDIKATGACIGEYKILLNYKYANNIYDNSREDFLKWALPIMVHEGYHHKFYFENKEVVYKPPNLVKAMEEAPAYFIEAYISSKVFAESINVTWQNRASLIRHRMTGVLCGSSDSSNNYLSAILELVKSKRHGCSDDPLSERLLRFNTAMKMQITGAKSSEDVIEAKTARAIAIVMFAANGYKILETMQDLDKPWIEILNGLIRKLKNNNYFEAVKENVHSIIKIKNQTNELLKESEKLDEDKQLPENIRESIQECMQRRTDLIKNMLRISEMQAKM
ncbi:hypothetical protein M1141_01490 [Candidatus Marsarchaeota archaeon]|nr:hypothetical protein [Candidatus Marsarchaeota archaeon]